MRAVIYRGPGEMVVEERPKPEIAAPGDALVRITMTTICGTDLRIFWGMFPFPPGTAVGHEFVGVVEAVGTGVRRLHVGQRVVAPFLLSCGTCHYCRLGILNECAERQIFGFGGLGGGQADYVVVPDADRGLEPIPDGVSDEQAAFLSDVLPGTCAGMEYAGIRTGDTVAVVGCGPTGLCAQMFARHFGAATVFAIDHHPERLAMAKRLGSVPIAPGEDAGARVRAATAGRGADVAVEATGTTSGLLDALALVRVRGAFVTLGIHLEPAIEFPIASFNGRQVTWTAAPVPPVQLYVPRLLRLIEAGGLDPSPIATHVLSLDDAAKGYAMMANRTDGALKVLLRT